MKVLVVIFALLGVLGTGGLGLLVRTAVNTARQPSASNPDGLTLEQQLDEISALPDQTPAATAAVECGQGVVRAAKLTVGSFFGAAAGGLLLVVLVLANLGPKIVHGVVLMGAGATPIGLTSVLTGKLGAFADALNRFDPGSARNVDGLANLPLFVAAASGGLILAGVFALLVKRDA